VAKLLVLAVLVLASCARPADEATSRPRPSDSASPVGPTSPAPGTTVAPSQVPDELRFTAPELGDGTIRGADFARQDLVMWFWAPW
jgi:hypothetical protein